MPIRAPKDARTPRSTADLDVDQPVHFAPKIRGDRYEQLVDLVEEGGDTLALQRRLVAYAEVIAREDGDAGAHERAAVLVLADLLRQGWEVFLDGGSIWVASLSGRARRGERVEQVKDRVRETLCAFRDVQLAEPAVRAFLQGMERPRPHRGVKVSVLDLVDDGHALSVALADASRFPPSKRGAALDAIVRPVLQVATPDERCEHTGLLLYDIWRYFRHTWSLEYRPTPGRSLAFLIRNAARPNAPVMGIASIANAAMQLRVRDDWVGWSTKAFVTSLRSDPKGWPARREAMIAALAAARDEVRDDDLLEQVGAVVGAELERRLRGLAEAAKAERKRMLREREERERRGEAVESLRALPRDERGQVDWRAASERLLFVAKRADTLANLLFAAQLIDALPNDATAVAAQMSDELRRAFSIAAREVRKVGLSSRLLDVNVCGAVAPYRDLLVGKLTALAMASREVSEAYQVRYRGQVSEIASQVAARPISRSPDVCLLTTTSLYGVAASQYNRLKVAVSTPGGGATTVRWRDLGLTEGWGTTHFSEATVEALRALAEVRTINNVFGEGQSPRLRQAREGLSRLGLEQRVYLKHRHARRVYALELVEGAREALRLNGPAGDERPTFEAIAGAWRDRWLTKRILSADVRARVAEQGPATVRAELAPPEGAQLALFARSKRSPGDDRVVRWGGFMAEAEQSNPGLIQSLYRALGACADHHSDDTVALLHITTPVDDFIRQKAPGRVIFVTGNPGDGKTHLLRRLSDELADAKVEVCLDANERPNAELIEDVRKAARSRTRGLAIAINEGILVQLLRAAEEEPWAASARRQLLSPLVYRDGEEDGEEERFMVIDLNLRNNLSPEIVRAALERMIAVSAPCTSCPGESGCSLQANAARLRRPEVAARVGALLDAVASVGVHATMRDLQGFLAFLMNGEQACEDEERYSDPYWLNAFEGAEGALFDAVRRFDPAEVTHPLLDDVLWRRADQDGSWALPWPREIDASPPLTERVEEFLAVKRRALFEHEQGAALLRSSDQVDNELRELLEGGTSATRRCVRLLNRFFDRDEERSEILYLWMTHRYDADVSRHAAAVLPVPVSQLELIVPRLRPSLRGAFPDYRPDHAVLVAKDMAPRDGLRVDRTLLEALLAAEQGLPSNFRRGEPEARIAAFISKLAKRHGDLSRHDQLAVWLVDRDTGNNVEVTVDLKRRRYVRG
ncbi:MAG: DUF4338 domain-containing protein [Myxococcales bacterium]|nr:DUF4338 domain-containing protein [Myxococcales bacterium]